VGETVGEPAIASSEKGEKKQHKLRGEVGKAQNTDSNWIEVIFRATTYSGMLLGFL
jgi:hypothetical protein